MRGQLLRGAADNGIRLPPAIGERGQLCRQRRGVLACRNAGLVEQPDHVGRLAVRPRQQREQDAETGMRAAGRVGQLSGMIVRHVDLLGHAGADRGKLCDRSLAHRHQRGRLLGELLPVGVDRSGKDGDSPLQARSLGAHRPGGFAEAARFRRAGAQRQQHQDTDQCRRHAQGGDESRQGDWRGRRQAGQSEPQHRADPAERYEDRERRNDPARAAGRIDIGRLGKFDRFFGRAFGQHRILFRCRSIGFSRPQVDDPGAPIHFRCLPRISLAERE